MRRILATLTMMIIACATPPPVAVPSPSPATPTTPPTASPMAALPSCFAPPPPTYLPWGAVGTPERATNERGVAYDTYRGPQVGGASASAYFAVARAPAERLFPLPPGLLTPRDVSGRSVIVHRVGDPGVGEVAARWQEGMDGCTYDAHLYYPSAGGADETEIAKIVASLDVWAAARAQLPTSVAVLKPTYLPARFTQPPWILSLFNDAANGPRYYIGYGAIGESLLFYLGAANSAPPTSSEAIAVRGMSGTLGTTASWPAIQVIWVENGHPYQIQDGGGLAKMTAEELKAIVAGLVEVR